jgi:tRNA-dihydrouridine synthase B
VRDLAGGEAFRQQMNRIEDCDVQLAAIDAFFELQLAHGERLQYRPAEERLAA